MSIKAYGTVTVINVDDGAKGEQGDIGVSVVSVTPMYRLSNSATQLVGGTWSEKKPAITTGKYLWTMQRTEYSDGNTRDSAAVYDATITNVESRVSQAEQNILNKVTQDDINSSIEAYDNGTDTVHNSIRNRVTQTETDISGIRSSVTDIQSTLQTKADGSTVSSISTRVSTLEQDVSGFHTTVENTYATKTENATTLSTAKSYAEQLSDRFYLYVEGQDGTSSITLTNNALEAMTSQFIVKDPNGSATIISGGRIHANAITTAMLATDAIKSLNYTKTGGNTSAYSTTGSYFNLSTGNIETPNFAVDNANGKAYINGEVIATSGSIGNSANNYWEIGTKTDYNASQSAAIIAHGSSYIQSGQFMIHDNKINTQSYATNRTITYPKYNNIYYDFGVQVPQLNTSTSGYIAGISDLFLYARKHESTIPQLESDWEYVFKVDKDGTIYENGVKLSDKYASISGVDGAYLPLTGGIISGNLTVQGTLTATASKAIADKNGLDISTAYLKLAGGTVTGDLIVSKASGFNYSGIQNAIANANRNVWFSDSNNRGKPVYNDSFKYNPSTNTLTVGSITGNATTATTATKALQDEDGNVIKNTYFKTTGGTISGATIINAELQADSISAGNLVVNGVARFNNDLYGNLTGNITGSASKLSVSAGSATQPIYFDNGIPVATTYALNKTVPSNAVFTDTNWYHTSGSWSGLTYTATKSNSSMGALAFTIPTGTSSTTVAVGNHTHTNYASKITLAGTDYSVSNNTITISQANLQSAVQSTDYVLMTTAERSKLSSIEVTEGGTIDFSGVTASAPLTATVNSSTGAVNITHNTSGVSAGTYKSVTVNTYGHVTAGTNPTTLSGYGITDAKITNGVITLGNNTITPLTASSTLDATKLSGTASISTTGNASTATKATQDGDGNTISSTYLKLSGGTLTNHLLLTKAGEIGVKVNNTNASHEIDLIVSSNGSGGIYDRTYTKWIVYSDVNGNVQLNGNASTATTATSANTAISATQDGNGNTISSTYLPLTGGTVTGTLILSKTSDTSGTTNTSPALIIGGTATQPHIEIDNNEIQCKDSATTTKALYLNLDGGSVNVGEGGFVSRGNVTVGSHARLSYNSTYQCLEFSFI